MKKILNILMAALVLTGISCSEDLEYKPGGVTPVQTLLQPADNYYVELQSASTATLRFRGSRRWLPTDSFPITRWSSSASPAARSLPL